MIFNLFQESPLTLIRAIQVYVVQGSLIPYFMFLVYKILKRDKKRLNYIFSFTYIINIIACLVNFIYAPFSYEPVVLFLNFLTTILIAISTIFNLIFILIILKSEKVINLKKQILIIGVYCFALVMSIFIYYNPELGITMNSTTKWVPVWKWPLFLYITGILTFYVVIPGFYYIRKVYKKFEDKDLKKKWGIFFIGQTMLYILIYLGYLANTLNVQSIRTIFSIISLFFVIFGAYGTYYGVLRQL